MAAENEDFDNFENLVKKYMPEFIDITRIPFGQVSNFAQGEMSEMLNNGVVPKDIEPPFPVAMFMEIENGRSTHK